MSLLALSVLRSAWGVFVNLQWMVGRLSKRVVCAQKTLFDKRRRPCGRYAADLGRSSVFMITKLCRWIANVLGLLGWSGTWTVRSFSGGQELLTGFGIVSWFLALEKAFQVLCWLIWRIELASRCFLLSYSQSNLFPKLRDLSMTSICSCIIHPFATLIDNVCSAVCLTAVKCFALRFVICRRDD